MALDALGIDIAKASFDAAIWQDRKTKSKNYTNTATGFEELLASLDGKRVHACLEATSRYGEKLARALYDAGHVVSIVNPFAIHRYAQSKLRRAKTDGVDAKLLAEYCAKEQPRAWVPPTPERTALKELTRRLESFQEDLDAEKNRLETDGAAAEFTKKHISHLEEAIQQLKRRIQQHIDAHPELKRQRDLVASIKGIGIHTASILLAEIGEISNYATAKQLAAYAGVCPRLMASGQWVGQTRMSKMGNSRLRKALYLPAIVAKNHNLLVKPFCERLLAKGKKKKAVVGAAMRKLLHIVFGVLKHGRAFNPAILDQPDKAPVVLDATRARPGRRAKKVA